MYERCSQSTRQKYSLVKCIVNLRVNYVVRRKCRRHQWPPSSNQSNNHGNLSDVATQNHCNKLWVVRPPSVGTGSCACLTVKAIMFHLREIQCACLGQLRGLSDMSSAPGIMASRPGYLTQLVSRVVQKLELCSKLTKTRRTVHAKLGF